MAQDDYYLLAYKLLLYLYGCLKNKTTFNKEVFRNICDNVTDDYFTNILKLLQDDGYVNGLFFYNSWGEDYMLMKSSIPNIRITPKGIEFLTENSNAKKAKEVLMKAGGIFADLISLVL